MQEVPHGDLVALWDAAFDPLLFQRVVSSKDPGLVAREVHWRGVAVEVPPWALARVSALR